VPHLSLQTIWHKHLRKSSCSASYSSLLLWLGLCQSQCAEYWIQLCFCPHRLLLLPSPSNAQIICDGRPVFSQCIMDWYVCKIQ
jgi:hypothetical protein